MQLGRPSDYTPDVCEIAVEFLKLGKSRAQLASKLDIAKSVMQRWERNNPDFKAAIELGLTHAESKWMDKGEENIDNKNFSVRMYELQMMNRFGWMRKIEERQDVNNNSTITLTLEEAEAKKFIDSKMKNV